VNSQIHSYFAGKKILLTGASGYLATDLTHALKDIACTLVRVSGSNTLLPIDGVAKVFDIKGNIRERDVWEAALEDIDIVYHLAAQTSAYVATENPVEDFKGNVLPMLNLLEVCKKKDKRPIILFAGTVTEVGLPVSLPVDETQQDNPVTIYDLHKLMAENYLKYYSQQEGIRGTTLRLSNVYGPGPKSSSNDRAVLNIMMRKALAGEPLTVYGHGDFLRDYIYIEDVTSAFLRAAISIERLNGKHFVLGSGEGHTIADAFNLVADRVAVKTGKRVPVQHIAPPGVLLSIEHRNFVADTGRFSSAAGWTACYSLHDGIDKTLDTF